MRTGGLILKKGEAEPCRVKPSTLPCNGGLQMVHLMKWSPDPLREMVTARPGATGSVGSRVSLLPPFKTWIPVSLILSPSLPALFPGLPPGFQVPSCVAGVCSTIGLLTSGSPAAGCWGPCLWGAGKVCILLSPNCWRLNFSRYFQHLWQEFKLPILKATRVFL